MIDLYFKSMHSMTQEEIDLIQHLTVGQSSNENWLKYRMYTLTASNFYSAAVNRVGPSSKLNSMFYSKFSFASVEHGRYYEPYVRNLYLQAMNEKDFKDIFVEDVGLLISSKNSFSVHYWMALFNATKTLGALKLSSHIPNTIPSN